MKKKCLRKSSIASFIIAGLCGLSAASPRPARANQELDRQFALETVGFLKAWDNVDGLFAEYVSTAYKEYFVRQSRFVVQDLSKADTVLTQSKLPYQKLIEDSEVLGQLSRSMRSESIIRTKVYKEGPQYRFTIDWLHAPKMELMSSETFMLEEPRDGKAFGIGDVKGALQGALERMIRKVPFSANVTGRDNNSVTVNIGAHEKLKKGDVLVVGTLDDVKRHPLLHAVVDWKITPVGRLVVEEVDEGIAFCKVADEDAGRQITRYQKITQVIPRPVKEQPLVTREKDESIEKLAEPPSLGWISGGLWVGGFSRQYSSLNNTVGKTGGGMFTGARAENQLWLTRDWFTEFGFGYGFSGYSQKDIASGSATAATGASDTCFAVHFDAGYTYYTTGDMFGPKAWVKLGYRATSYNLPISTDESTGPSSFKGFFLGVGGDLPIRANFGGLLTLDFGLLTSAEESGFLSGTVNGATDISFFAGGYYRWTNRLVARLGLDVLANGADFSSGTTLTHRVISLGPSLLFYF